MKDKGAAGRRLMDTPPEQVGIIPLLENRAAEAPEDVFFTFGDAVQTCGSFNALVNRVARNLGRAGIERGTYVAVLMETSLEYMALWFALAKIGAIEVVINTAYRGDLLAHALRTGRASVCIADGKYARQIAAVAADLSHLGVLVTCGAHDLDQAIPLRLVDFEDFFAPADEANIGADIHYSEIGGVIFTSGTTGPSKGVLLSHHYLAAYGFMYGEINGLGNDDVVLNYLPFFHIGAKFLTIATLVCRGRMRLMPRLSISGFWEEVRTHGVTNFVAVGGISNMLLGRQPQPDDADTSIRTIYAVPDPADSHVELEQRFGCRITTVYGSTEVGLPLFRGVHDAYQPGSCGRQSPYYEVQIIDENDQPVPCGVPGEVAIRPRRPFLVGSGYIGMPERTVVAMRNLWLHSGDRAVAAADGTYTFLDRATDSIRRRGENISSYEVEQLVAKHPAVAEVAAVPAPSEIGEDDVWIVVILREGHTASPEALLLHCAATMPYFMIPRFIDIVDAMPRTPTAKVEKYKLRSQGPGPSAWDREKQGWILTRHGLQAPADCTND